MPLFAFIFDIWFGAVAAAVGAVSVPIIIHLLNRRRFKIVVWAAMRFLLNAQRKNTRRMRLEQFILLAARCLLVLLLVLAMASITPWAESAWQRWFPDTLRPLLPGGGHRTHKIIVVDGSFSMAAKVGDQAAFDRARALARQIVTDSSRGDGFSVILMSAPPRGIVPRPADNPSRVAEVIDKMRLPHGNADLIQTLTDVKRLLADSPDKYEAREVYFLTDMQRATWMPGRPADISSALKEIEEIRKQARTIFVDVGADNLNNLAITSLTLGEPLAIAGHEATITVGVRNFGSEAREKVRVELFVGKARTGGEDSALDLRVVDQKVIERLEPRGAETADAKSANYQAKDLKFKFDSPGDYLIQARIDGGDPLPLDDVRSAVLTVRKDVPVLLVDGKKDEAKWEKKAAESLKLNINPFENAPVPGFAPFRPTVLSEKEFTDIGLGNLDKYDVVCFCDVVRLSAGEVRRLETHLRRGGGAVFALGERVDLAAYNKTLFREGKGLLPARLVERQSAKEKTWFRLKDADYTRPPLEAFDTPAYRASLESVNFRQYIKVDPAKAGGPRTLMRYSPVAAPGAEETALAGMPVGDPTVIEWQPPVAAFAEGDPGVKDQPPSAHARGRVVLMTSTANMDWNDWPASPSYFAFTQELMRYTIAGRLREQSVNVGEPIEEFLPSGSGALDVKLTIRPTDGGKDREETFRTVPSEEANVLRWIDTDTSGVYRAVVGRDPQEHLFAVNVPSATLAEDSTESDLARANKEQLTERYPGWEFQVVRELGEINHSAGPAGDSARPRTPAPIGPEIARWLLIAILLLLFAEAIMAWQFGHYTGTTTAAGPTSAGRWLPGIAAGVLGLSVLFIGGSLLHYALTGEFMGYLPNFVRGWLEHARGLSDSAPGEAKSWLLEFTQPLWDSVLDPWLIGLISLGGTALVIAIYREEVSATAKALRILFVGLRVGLLLLVLLMIKSPTLVIENKSLPDVVILIDDSYSMSTVDNYQDEKIRAAADALAQDGELSEKDRISLAKALVTRPQGDWLAKLLNERKFKVHVYHCSARAEGIADIVEPRHLADAVEKVKGLKADPANDSSQLGTAVRQVIDEHRGASLAAIIMLTDGVTTEGDDLAKTSEYASQMGVPLFFVGMGDSHEAKDLYLHDLEAPESVYTNDNIVFKINLTGHGFPDLSVPVELREKGKDKVLAKEQVKVDPSGKPTEVRLNYRPTEEGDKVFELRVPVQEGEANVENNVVEHPIEINKSKVIRVLFVEGQPRWEFRYIKTLLERENQRVEGNKSFDLKVLLLGADTDWPAQDKSAIAEFPQKQELDKFNVVVLGDFDPNLLGGGDDKKRDATLQNLADFVKGGHGLLMIAGEHHAPHAYKGTPLQDVLPIDLLTDRQPSEPAGGLTESYRPELTPIGQRHSIFSFNTSNDSARQTVWNHLKELYWCSLGYEAKPAAKVLVTHPKLLHVAGQAVPQTVKDAGSEGHPLVVQQYFGSGISLFFGINETWRWRWREDEQHFNEFWVQTMRFLARTKSEKVKLRLNKQTPYKRGEEIRITVEFPQESTPGDDVEVKVKKERHAPNAPQEDIEVEELTLTRMEGNASTFVTKLDRSPEGDYTFRLVSPPVPAPHTQPQAECKVLAPPTELEVLRMNQSEMEQAAAATRGQFYTIDRADNVIKDLPSGTRVTLNTAGPALPLWNWVWVFALVLGLFTLEWVLRKRKNLL